MEPLLMDAKLKIVNEGTMGAERAPLMMTITGNTHEEAMDYGHQDAGLLRKIMGASEVRLTALYFEIMEQLFYLQLNPRKGNGLRMSLTK